MTKDTGRPKHRGAGHHATSDIVFDADEAEFLRAIEEYQRSSGNKFPTYTQVLRIAKSLGYAKPYHDD